MINAHPMIKGSLSGKSCTKCKAVKPLSEFRADTRYKLGVSSRCKKCCSRGKRSKEPAASASQEEQQEVARMIEGTRDLAIAIYEYFHKQATTPERRQHYTNAINNLQGGAA